MNPVEVCVKPNNSVPYKPAICHKVNECYKIKMIIDHDWLDSQYAEAIRDACERCS
jgi:hypothetical protein